MWGKVKEFGESVTETVTDTVVKIPGGAEQALKSVPGTVGSLTSSSGNPVVVLGDLGSATMSKLEDEVEDGYNKAKHEIEQWARDRKDELFKTAAEAATSNYARLIKEAAGSIPKINSCGNNPGGRLATMLQEPRNIDLKQLSDLLVELMSCSAFSGVIQEAKNMNFGSLLLMAGGGAGFGVGVEGSVGVAISLAAAEIGRKFAIFAAGGVSIGATVGGSGDFVLGFNRNYPKGCGGATFDVNMELKASHGGNVGCSFDPALPPNLQQIVVGIGAGEEVNVSVGAGFTHIITIVDEVERYAIRTPNGRNYLMSIDGGGKVGHAPLLAHATAIGPWEEFELVEVDRSQDKYALKTHNGHFVSFKDAGGTRKAGAPIETWAEQVGGWEQLRMVPLINGKIALMTPNGTYLAARDGGGHGGDYPVRTASTRIQDLETFTLAKL